MLITGSIVALVTPMNTDGSINKKALSDLIEWHIASKTDGLVVAGTTGESPTLTTEEHFELISTVVTKVANRIPVIAGTGSNSTKHTILLTQQAKKAGAQAALISTPYYNKPPQNGMYEHFKTIAQEVALPIILYNVPGRTACDLLPETIERLSKIPSIIGIKEATGKIERAIDIMKRCDNTFVVYSGDDITCHDLMVNGAKGVISVTANVAPREMHDLCDAIQSGNTVKASALNEKLLPLHHALFIESNPIPVKWALYEMKKIPAGIRLPLLPLDAIHQEQLKQVLQKTGIL